MEYADSNNDWALEGKSKTYIPGLAEAAGSNPSTDAYRYYVDDRLGSVRGVFDQSKAVVAKYDYQPFGETRLALGMQLNRGYTGHMWDAHVQQYFAPYRLYSPGSSRWLSRDPLGFVDGMNMYAYVRGNPVGYMDPMGGSAALIGRCGIAAGGFIAGGIGSILETIAQAIAAIAMANALSNAMDAIPHPSGSAIDAAGDLWGGRTPPSPWVPPINPDANWHNPDTGESLRPDFGHGDPIGPHVDWHGPKGEKGRIDENGVCTPK